MKSLDVIKPIENQDPASQTKHYLFFCPGCRIGHIFETPMWEFNGDFVKPTVRSSYLIYEDPAYRKASNDRHGHRCHSFITDGNIEFCNDCTHSLAGKTVPLKPFDSIFGDEK